MKRLMKSTIAAAAIIGMTSLISAAPAEAHNNNNAYMNQLAMQMYANNIAAQQQAAYNATYCNRYHPVENFQQIQQQVWARANYPNPYAAYYSGY